MMLSSVEHADAPAALARSFQDPHFEDNTASQNGGSDAEGSTDEPKRRRGKRGGVRQRMRKERIALMRAAIQAADVTASLSSMSQGPFGGFAGGRPASTPGLTDPTIFDFGAVDPTGRPYSDPGSSQVLALPESHSSSLNGGSFLPTITEDDLHLAQMALVSDTLPRQSFPQAPPPFPHPFYGHGAASNHATPRTSSHGGGNGAQLSRGSSLDKDRELQYLMAIYESNKRALYRLAEEAYAGIDLSLLPPAAPLAPAAYPPPPAQNRPRHSQSGAHPSNFSNMAFPPAFERSMRF